MHAGTHMHKTAAAGRNMHNAIANALYEYHYLFHTYTLTIILQKIKQIQHIVDHNSSIFNLYALILVPKYWSCCELSSGVLTFYISSIQAEI